MFDFSVKHEEAWWAAARFYWKFLALAEFSQSLLQKALSGELTATEGAANTTLKEEVA